MENETPWWTGRSYSHIKVPKALFKNPLYENISPLAKLLYGFLLDRTSLSYANGEDWLNENGEAFVYYPITEIMERFGCGHDKAASLLQELERAGLISRTLKGRGRPYRIVVNPFTMSPEDQKSTARNCRTADLGNPDRNKPENKPDRNHPDPITTADRVRAEVQIKENISYEVLLEQVPQRLLDGIVDVIVDTLCTRSPTVSISGTTVPRSEVHRRFLELDQMDICYVHDQLKKETQEIRYLRSYILARLYEAKNLSDIFYSRWADRDLNKPPAGVALS